MTGKEQTTSLSTEEQLAVLKARLNDAQRLTAIGELASTTTHEFNNILMTILNYARLGMRHQDQPTRDKAFEKILAAAQRAAKITNCVLGMARNRRDQMEPTDLVAVVEDALLLLERELNKYQIQVEKHWKPVPKAVINGNQIQQVLVNLVVNARQAMASGGRLTLKIQHDPVHDTVDLIVRDTGKGIPADVLPRIFDPYFTTKTGPDASGQGGTGLGLAACREIIEAHRGRIRVESTAGKGTAFTLKLPAEKPQLPPSTIETSASDQVGRSSTSPAA